MDCHIVINCLPGSCIWLCVIKYSLTDLYEVDKVMPIEVVALTCTDDNSN